MLIKNLKSKSKARQFTAVGLSTGDMHPELVHDMCWEERPGKWAEQNKAFHAPAFPGNAPSLIKNILHIQEAAEHPALGVDVLRDGLWIPTSSLALMCCLVLRVHK